MSSVATSRAREAQSLPERLGRMTKSRHFTDSCVFYKHHHCCATARNCARRHAARFAFSAAAHKFTSSARNLRPPFAGGVTGWGRGQRWTRRVSSPPHESLPRSMYESVLVGISWACNAGSLVDCAKSAAAMSSSVNVGAPGCCKQQVDSNSAPWRRKISSWHWKGWVDLRGSPPG